MHALKVAGAVALNMALMTGVGAAADVPQDAIIKISATAIDGADANHKKLDFSCTVESQGAVIGTFNSMQASLTVSHALPELHMTCNKAGYETVRLGINGPVTKGFAPKFTAGRAS